MKETIYRLVLYLVFILAMLSVNGCGPDHSNDNATLSSELHKTTLTRDPTQIPPNYVQQQTLDYYDNQMLMQMHPRNDYLSELDIIRSSASISPSVYILIDDDFKKSQIPAGGGVTGNSFIAIDGKFLDILSDYAHYRAITDKGFPGQLMSSALDNIVYYHNSFWGKAAPLYSVASYPSDVAELANRYFCSYAGAIVYHEFGHYYLYHMHDNFLSTGTVFQTIVQYSSLNEDLADAVSGMLTKKAGNDVSKAMEMVDIMAYYTLQKTGQVTSFTQIVSSLPAQFYTNTTQYSSLAGRKNIISNNYNSY